MIEFLKKLKINYFFIRRFRMNLEICKDCKYLKEIKHHPQICKRILEDVIIYYFCSYSDFNIADVSKWHCIKYENGKFK